MMVDIEQLNKMTYKDGKKLLLQNGYIQNDSAVDDQIEANGRVYEDIYYTLYDNEGNEVHIVSFETQFDPEDTIRKEQWIEIIA